MCVQYGSAVTAVGVNIVRTRARGAGSFRVSCARVCLRLSLQEMRFVKAFGR